MKTIYLKNFTSTPGGRTRSVNKNAGHSGEEWREQVLVPELKQAIEQNEILMINLNGVAGWPIGFIDEAFAGLVDHFPHETILQHLKTECQFEDVCADVFMCINDYAFYLEERKKLNQTPAELID